MQLKFGVKRRGSCLHGTKDDEIRQNLGQHVPPTVRGLAANCRSKESEALLRPYPSLMGLKTAITTTSFGACPIKSAPMPRRRGRTRASADHPGPRLATHAGTCARSLHRYARLRLDNRSAIRESTGRPPSSPRGRGVGCSGLACSGEVDLRFAIGGLPSARRVIGPKRDASNRGAERGPFWRIQREWQTHPGTDVRSRTVPAATRGRLSYLARRSSRRRPGDPATGGRRATGCR
jgi:hypothetical protein